MQTKIKQKYHKGTLHAISWWIFVQTRALVTSDEGVLVLRDNRLIGAVPQIAPVGRTWAINGFLLKFHSLSSISPEIAMSQ